jgi:processive 1,2-diacylglycerol beta-glucosyltransferase
MSKRVLILSASVGGGHLRAAEAIEQACRRFFADLVVENHDVLEFTNRVFRRVYADSYLELVGRAPHVLGYLYDWLDQPSSTGHNVSDRLRQTWQKLNLKRFERFLSASPWDLAINTHFLPAELIADLRNRGRIRLPQVTVCTDFETHRLWVNQPCERYFCATQEGACYVSHWGVEPTHVEVTGIPVHPSFSDPVDREKWRDRYRLDPKRPLLLQMCGGFGVGPVEEITNRLLETPQPLQLAVICGRNEALKERIGKIRCPKRHRLLPLGFTNEMDQWMGSADLLISKPGGLTTSEALARGLPMVVVNPIPGQESRNSDFLLENGAAVKANHPALLPLKVSRLLESNETLVRMARAARSLGRPHAARDIIERSLAIISK